MKVSRIFSPVLEKVIVGKTHTNDDLKIQKPLDQNMKVEATFMDLWKDFKTLIQKVFSGQG